MNKSSIEDVLQTFNDFVIEGLLKSLRDSVYSTNNPSLIQAYEKKIVALAEDVGITRGEFDYETYRAARNQGLNHAQMVEKFALPNKNVLNGYARWYKTRRGK